MTGRSIDKSALRRPLVTAVAVALLAAAAVGAGSAQAALSPYPSTGYPSATGGSVEAIAISGNTVYVGGSFRMFGGQARNRLAAFNLETGAVLSWNPNVSSDWAYVYSLAVSGSDVYVGGNFTTIGGLSRNRIAKVGATGTGTVDATWNPSASSDVYSLAVSGSSVYVGGYFSGISSIGGQDRNRIAKLSTSGTGSADTTWNPNASSYVRALKVSGSDLYAVGDFTTIGGQARNRIAKLSATGTGAAGSWDPSIDNGNVYALMESGSDVYVGGDFSPTDGGVSAPYLAKVDASTGSTSSWSPNPDTTVRALAASGTNVIAGGYFTTVGGMVRERLAMYDSAGNLTSWNPKANSGVTALASSGTTVIAGGNFNKFGYGDDEVVVNRLAVFKDAETPANTSQPQIAGAAALGGALSCSTGNWSAGDANLVSSYSYRWKRSGSAISGATSSTYTVSASDAGATLSCEVTAANFVGSSSADSGSVTVDGSTSGTVPAPVTPATPITVEPSATISWPGYGSKLRRVRKFKGHVDAGAVKVQAAIQKIYRKTGSRAKKKKGARKAAKWSCRAFKENSRARVRFSRRGSCSSKKWLDAEITRTGVWRLKLKRSLPTGQYKILVRVYDSAGNVSSTYSKDSSNLCRFKVTGSLSRSKKR